MPLRCTLRDLEEGRLDGLTEECWLTDDAVSEGLTVWKDRSPPEIPDRSLAEYDRLDDSVRMLRERVSRAHGRFVGYDLHSYNRRRGGPGAAPADPASNPHMTANHTSPKTTRGDREIPASMISAVARRLALNQRVRRTLPENGRLHIDRQLPFLCVYRQPPDRDDQGTQRLVKGEASYLVVSGRTRMSKNTSALVREVVKTLSDQFGAFLIVELWAASDEGHANDAAMPDVPPQFTIHAPVSASMTGTIEALERRLRRIKILKQGVHVQVIWDGKGHPPELKPLLKLNDRRELNCSVVGLAVPPVYRDLEANEEYPLLFNSLRRNLSLALRQTYFEFSRAHTTHRPAHYHALGRRAVVKAVWDVDRQLAAIGNQFDYLLLLTPVNATAAWKQFKRNRFQRVPEFHYHPLPIDPALVKRQLYRIPIERVEDPALHRLFCEKRDELEAKLTMLRDRDTQRFLYDSLQLFGNVKSSDLALAKDLLDRLPAAGERGRGKPLDARQFARRIEAEFEVYRKAWPEFHATTEVSSDVSGLLVSGGRLLINADLILPASRIEPLLAHEVGTHLVTYFNGHAQPFQQLYSGLAGYEELQEGLAVLSEYLVGGLNRSRIRQLGARVVAVWCRVEGASFVDTFRTLVSQYACTQRAAYQTTMRVYRGGGLTKDAIYLRGLEAMLRYVQRGGELEPLLVGKLAVEHIPIIKELQYRKVLQPAPIVPRYLRDPAALARLEGLRGGSQSVIDLASDSAPK